MKSILISFEGIECSGKSTQIKIFEEFLRSQNKQKIHLLREPGGTELGEKIRSLLLDENLAMNPLSELFLFLAARAQNIQDKIKPLLIEDNNIILLDRFLDSSIAYQGAGRGLNADFVKSIHNHQYLNTFPDLTFFIDISVDTLEKRIEKRGEGKDRLESENKEFFSSIRNEFLNQSKLEKRIIRINGEQEINEISKNIQNIWSEYIS